MTELSGTVAILDEHGAFVELRDLGPDPVGVKPGRALPARIVRPDASEGEGYGSPDIVVSEDEVVVTYTLIAIPSAPYTISKDGIWRRATESEVEAMDAALEDQPVRVRRIYDGSTHISSDDALFALLVTTMSALFSEDRAAELLAPSV